ncbi:endospore germination permease [Metabacillus sp. GX 13764]|uniref:GerAB/ArcD/ProY family transporter n=1 Tax=Metabacillus kandeliae TaxID=2900151 RepID=UPI001E5CA2B6|nr:endospore germination permease [Metabacillus kandeliae]MCD7032920.1 endospore germination permease [Metabacillus kandeliae]
MKHTLTKGHLLMLTVSFITGSSLLMAPGITTAAAKNNGWISMLIAAFCGLLLNLLLVFLIKKYRYQSIFDCAEKAAGPFIGGVITLLIVFYSLHLAAYVVRNVSNFMITSVNPEGSTAIYEAALLTAVCFTTLYGLNNLARLNEFLLPGLFFLLIASFGLVINQFDGSHLKPFFRDNPGSLVMGAYPTVGFPFIEIISLMSLFSYVSNKKHLGRSFLLTLFLSGCFLAASVVLCIGVEGYDLVSRQPYATFEIMRGITIVKLFERIEILTGTFWIFGIFIKITICFLAAMLGLQKLARHNSYYSFLLPSAVFVWVMSLEFHPDTVDFSHYVTSVWTLWWFTLYVLVCLVLLIGIMRKKHKPEKPSWKNQLPEPVKK